MIYLTEPHNNCINNLKHIGAVQTGTALELMDHLCSASSDFLASAETVNYLPSISDRSTYKGHGSPGAFLFLLRSLVLTITHLKKCVF